MRHLTCQNLLVSAGVWERVVKRSKSMLFLSTRLEVRGGLRGEGEGWFSTRLEVLGGYEEREEGRLEVRGG